MYQSQDHLGTKPLPVINLSNWGILLVDTKQFGRVEEAFVDVKEKIAGGWV